MPPKPSLRYTVFRAGAYFLPGGIFELKHAHLETLYEALVRATPRGTLLAAHNRAVYQGEDLARVSVLFGKVPLVAVDLAALLEKYQGGPKNLRYFHGGLEQTPESVLRAYDGCVQLAKIAHLGCLTLCELGPLDCLGEVIPIQESRAVEPDISGARYGGHNTSRWARAPGRREGGPRDGGVARFLCMSNLTSMYAHQFSVVRPPREASHDASRALDNLEEDFSVTCVSAQQAATSENSVYFGGNESPRNFDHYRSLDPSEERQAQNKALLSHRSKLSARGRMTRKEECSRCHWGDADTCDIKPRYSCSKGAASREEVYTYLKNVVLKHYGKIPTLEEPWVAAHFLLTGTSAYWRPHNSKGRPAYSTITGVYPNVDAAEGLTSPKMAPASYYPDATPVDSSYKYPFYARLCGSYRNWRPVHSVPLMTPKGNLICDTPSMRSCGKEYLARLENSSEIDKVLSSVRPHLVDEETTLAYWFSVLVANFYKTPFGNYRGFSSHGIRLGHRFYPTGTNVARPHMDTWPYLPLDLSILDYCGFGLNLPRSLVRLKEPE